jgi:hypothetical protein
MERTYNNQQGVTHMKTDIAEAAVIDSLPVVADATLIKVKTISPKLVETLDYLDGNQMDRNVDLTGVEVLGKLPKYGTLIVRDTKGDIYQLRSFAMIQWLMKQGMDNARANEVAGNYPQLFPV